MKELKEELQTLADCRFFLDMKDRWNEEDYKKDNEMLKRIKEIIDIFKKNKIEVNYRHGYPIEYKEK